jgi:hypothetical protein
LKAQIDAWPNDLTALSVSRLRTTYQAPKLDMKGASNFFKDFHQQFVVTKVDKLSNTMVAVCRKYYVQILQQDLQGSGYFCGLQGPVLTEKMLHDQVSRKLQTKFPFLVVPGEPKLAYAAVLVKMHKNPFAFRFLASCSNDNLKNLGTWVTALCRSLEHGVQALWDKQIRRGGLQGVGMDKVFFIRNSFSVVDVLKRFNVDRVSVQHFLSTGGVTSKDCTRMYSNMPQTDLKDRLKTMVFRYVWQLHYKSGTTNIPFDEACSTRPDRLPVLKVYKQIGHKCIWYDTLQDAQYKLRHSLIEGSDMEGKDQQGEYLLFTLADAQEFVDILIDHAFIQSFDLLFQQIKGILIGVSPGVYLANFYLFTYELQFLTQLATIVVENPPVEGVQDDIGLELLNPSPELLQELHNGQPSYRKGHLARLVWRAFRYTCRFVDDLQSIANRFIASLLYNDMSIAGGLIRGIYCRDCPWEDTAISDDL